MSWSSEEFFKAWPTHGPKREAAFVREIIKGNVPSWQMKLVKVGDCEVSPDYLAIGTDADYVRVPLTAYAAAYVARELKLELPLKPLVDQIAKAAIVRTQPLTRPWHNTPGAAFLGANYRQHSKDIDAQMSGLQGRLSVGAKKDLLGKYDGNMLWIYGWHRLNGTVWQNESNRHDLMFCDYSHGARLVRTPEGSGLSGLPFGENYPAEFLKAVTA